MIGFMNREILIPVESGKIIVDGEKSRMGAMSQGEIKWDMDNFFNDYMGIIGYI